MGRGGNTWIRREDVREALTAIMRKSPHRQTIARVYEKIDIAATDPDRAEQKQQMIEYR